MVSDSVGSLRTIRARQRALMRWYRTHGRHDLPWRLTRDPYGILVSEVMLQQTQVDRVIPYWTTWMRRWPTVEALARASRASVIRAWAGLGYNRRAVYLHRAAQEITRNGWPNECRSLTAGTSPKTTIVENGDACQWLFGDGPLPPSPPLPAGGGEIKQWARELQRLPGIGPYTANALLAFAWNLPAPCVDTNVRRVLAHAILKRPALMRAPLAEVMRAAARVIPPGRGRAWNYALMDYGALVLTAREALQWPTPGVGHHVARQQVGRFEGSSRFWRGRIVAELRRAPRALPYAVLRKRLLAYGDPPDDLVRLLVALARDGVIRRTPRGDRLA